MLLLYRVSLPYVQSRQKYALTLVVSYTYFRVPEPKGRTFAELDLLFERGVSARKFATTEVDVFDETVDDSVISNYKDAKATEHSEKVIA